MIALLRRDRKIKAKQRVGLTDKVKMAIKE